MLPADDTVVPEKATLVSAHEPVELMENEPAPVTGIEKTAKLAFEVHEPLTTTEGTPKLGGPATNLKAAFWLTEAPLLIWNLDAAVRVS